MVDAVPVFLELIEPATNTALAAQALNNRAERIEAAIDLFNAQVEALDGRTDAVEQNAIALTNRVSALENHLAQERQAREAQHHHLVSRLADQEGSLHHLRRELRALEEKIDDHWREFQRGIALIQDHETQMPALREELEDFIAYEELAALGEAYFRDLLERVGITSSDQLRERDPEQLYSELQRYAEQERHYESVPAARNRRVLVKIIQLSQSPPAATRRASPRRPQS